MTATRPPLTLQQETRARFVQALVNLIDDEMTGVDEPFREVYDNLSDVNDDVIHDELECLIGLLEDHCQGVFLPNDDEQLR